jgi:hypothetical protein
MPKGNPNNEINDLLMKAAKPEAKPEAETKWDELGTDQQADMVVAEQQAEPQDACEVLAEELKENIDYLMMAYKKGDKKRIMYRIGQVSRQFVILGRKCAEFPEAVIVEPNKGIIV